MIAIFVIFAFTIPILSSKFLTFHHCISCTPLPCEFDKFNNYFQFFNYHLFSWNDWNVIYPNSFFQSLCDKLYVRNRISKIYNDIFKYIVQPGLGSNILEFHKYWDATKIMLDSWIETKTCDVQEKISNKNNILRTLLCSSDDAINIHFNHVPISNLRRRWTFKKIASPEIIQRRYQAILEHL